MAKGAGSSMPLKGSQFVRRIASSIFVFFVCSAPQPVRGLPPSDEGILFVHRWFDMDQDDGDASKPQQSNAHEFAPAEATADVAKGIEITNGNVGSVANHENIA